METVLTVDVEALSRIASASPTTPLGTGADVMLLAVDSHLIGIPPISLMNAARKL